MGTAVDHPKVAHNVEPVGPNDVSVEVSYGDLAPHIIVVKPSRPAITYERME